MRSVVFVFVVVACHCAMSSLRLKVASTQVKELKALEVEPTTARIGDKFSETLASVESVAEDIGEDHLFTKSKISKVSLDKLECAINQNLNENKPHSMFKHDALDKETKLRSYGTAWPIKAMAEFRLFPDDLDGLDFSGLTFEAVEQMHSGDQDEEEEEKIDFRLREPCLHVAILQDTEHRSLGKVEWIDSRCQSGNAMMGLADQLFQCFGVVQASLNNVSSIECGSTGKNVQLSLLRTLTHGETWYQKFGYESVHWEGEHLQNVLALQRALHDVSFVELRGVWVNCGIPRVLESGSQTLVELISSLFSKHDDLIQSQNVSVGTPLLVPSDVNLNAGKPGTIGYFADWLARNHCEHAQEVLDSALVFPCPHYRNSSLRDLQDDAVLDDVNAFAGAMVKQYSGP